MSVASLGRRDADDRSTMCPKCSLPGYLYEGRCQRCEVLTMQVLLMKVLQFPGAKHEVGAWSELAPEIKEALRGAGVLP